MKWRRLSLPLILGDVTLGDTQHLEDARKMSARNVQETLHC